jgi:MFS transporter, AAHS family, 4-hydroxybenzoate transporter
LDKASADDETPTMTRKWGAMGPLETVDVESVVGRAPLGRIAILVTVLAFIVVMLDGYDLLCLSFVAPALAKAMHRDVASFGPAFSSGMAGILLGGFAISPLSDKLGRKPVLLASVAVFGLFSFLPVLDLSYERLLLYRLLTGVGLGGAISSAAALTSEYAPHRYRGLLVNLMFAGVATGGVVGGFLASRLIPVYGWQAAFWMGGVAPLVLLPVLAWLMPESVVYLAPSGKRPAYIARMLNKLDPGAGYVSDGAFVARGSAGARVGNVAELFRANRSAGTLLLWLVSFCSMFTFGLTVSWLPAILEREGFALESAVLGPVLMNLGGVAGTILLGYILNFRGPAALIAWTLSLTTGALLATGQTLSVAAPAFLSIFVAGLFLLGSINSTNALMAAYYPTQVRATGVGWALGVGRVGGTIGPAIGGLLLSAKLTAPAIFSITALASALGAAAIVAMGSFYPQYRRPAAVHERLPAEEREAAAALRATKLTATKHRSA